MTATIHRVGETVDAIDLFCGYGGSSQGIHAAGADLLVACNHNELAIECHAANYPDTDHRRADLSNPDAADYLDPADLPPARFLWASPSCKYHSPANARKLYAQGPQAVLPGFDDGEEFDQVAYANSERSRVTMVCPLRYASRHHPELVVIENVVEAAKWGPNRDGSTFRWWLSEWEKLGYEHECLFLNSMFFPPCPQSRDRMYVVLWRRGKRKPDLDHRPTAQCTSDRCQGAIVQAVQAWKRRTAAWPLDRWGKYDAQYVYRCPDCSARVHPVAWPACTAIDWSNLGPTMADRRDNGTELAESTMDRIVRGLVKFRNGPPVLIPAKATWGVERSVAEPMPTQTSQGERGLVSADGMVLPLRTNDGVPRQARHVADPLGTLVAGNVGHAFITKNNGDASEAQYRAKPVEGPLGAITAHPTQGLVVDAPASGHVGFAHVPFTVEMRGGGSVAAGQHPIIDPLHTVTAGGMHHGLTSMFTKVNGGPEDTAWHLPGEPLNTVTSRDTHGLVVLPWLEQFMSDPAAIDEQMATVMTRMRHALASIEPSSEPITTEDLDRVRFRMLSPDPELRRAMAFGQDYVLLGNKTQQTAGLGNAVTPPVSQWVTGQCLATLDSPAT